MSKDFFPPRPTSRPTLYAYEDTNPQYAGLLKVGYTTVDAQSRVAQQYPTLRPRKPTRKHPKWPLTPLPMPISLA